jgi:uncharacterized protein with HEPN domain
VSRNPVDNLGLTLDHLAVLEQYLDGSDLSASMTFDAVCMRLSAAIEALSRVPAEWLVAEFGAEWPRIRATRNAIAHVYDEVDETQIHRVVSFALPRFTAGVRNLVDRHAPGLRPELP